MSQNNSPTVTTLPPPHPPSFPSPQSDLISNQSVAIISNFTLESGVTLHRVSLAFKTWGRLNEAGEYGEVERGRNAMVICHALTGSADLEDWWGPLLGPSLAFDPTRYFIICMNVLGSPYGTSSPVTINPSTSKPYGPEFPQTSIRDDVRLQKILLDHLGVTSVSCVIGGSMGGMTCLEYPLIFPTYVRHIIPIATCSRHSAWGISWGEAQRQSIYSDPNYNDGWYDEKKPETGLAAARMAALLTYRSRNSFESRFGRKEQDSPRSSLTLDGSESKAWIEHNDGHSNFRKTSVNRTVSPNSISNVNGGNGVADKALEKVRESQEEKKRTIFRAQGYLRYQGTKFVNRFDANCYLHITRKMDTHDLARGRAATIEEVLAKEPKGALVISISSDGLFTRDEQAEIAEGIPDAKLVVVSSPDGHDGFLLEFEQINSHILSFLHSRSDLSKYYSSEPLIKLDSNEAQDFQIKKTSVFGEAEVLEDLPKEVREELEETKGLAEAKNGPDITRW